MKLSELLKLRRRRRALRHMITHARALYNMRRDIVDPGQAERLRTALAQARAARRGTADDIESAGERLSRAAGEWPTLHRNGWTENFEVLVVALGVAMAFRCYFFQPFKIPTGSMQPTLYGIHSREQATLGFFDKPGLKIAKWLVTGEWYREVRVTTGGRVNPLYHDDSKPGYRAFAVAKRRYFVPADAVDREELRVDRTRNVQPGALLWSGVVKAGDHLFVNRVAWNFRAPRRGEVMVFSTRDIPGLPPGTHYIKRMVGMPGETVAIRPPEVLINGAPVVDPDTIGRITRKERLGAWAPQYLGYQLIGGEASVDFEPALRREGDQVALGGAEYYAMGDNTGNSRDSRYWGPVPEANLLGPAAVVYWPFTSPRWGRIR